MKLLIFGMGYSAERFVALHRARFSRIGATVRTAEKAARLAARHPGLVLTPFDAMARDLALDAEIAQADAVLVSTPALGGDPALAAYGEAIAASPCRRIAYLSTIGVYADSGGAWIDETGALATGEPRLRARVEAEQGWRDLGQRAGKAVFILRLAGIYGPGRNALVDLRDGLARRIVKPGQVFNRIHVDDIAGAIDKALTTAGPDGVYNVVDDEPAPPQDVIAFAATLLGQAPPPETAFDPSRMSPMAASFWSSCKRVSNAALRTDLGVILKYPTYREGLTALCETGPV